MALRPLRLCHPPPSPAPALIAFAPAAALATTVLVGLTYLAGAVFGLNYYYYFNVHFRSLATSFEQTVFLGAFAFAWCAIPLALAVLAVVAAVWLARRAGRRWPRLAARLTPPASAPDSGRRAAVIAITLTAAFAAVLLCGWWSARAMVAYQKATDYDALSTVRVWLRPGEDKPDPARPAASPSVPFKSELEDGCMLLLIESPTTLFLIRPDRTRPDAQLPTYAIPRETIQAYRLGPGHGACSSP